ncbi:telomerase reverse transcriptase-like isoform X2 [Pseudomyrmex gracilis]|uniref:telomerase reverse transcriptase-like isoform X2 n=1 Tax=Pseudomyrmex gracilis TaxID=219809 RepID=UPI0009957F1E|nr:telomerase reverse transcriptase-like isoform X2 [Pseudomyrmex gracilis]
MDLTRKRPALLYMATSNKKVKLETNVTIIPVKFKSTVNLFASRCQVRKVNRTTASISKHHVLESRSTGRDICNRILNTNVELNAHDNNINLNNIIPVLSPILESYKKRHNRCNYSEKLKHITGNIYRKVKLKYKSQIPIHLLESFFNSVIYETVPLKLFGSLQNVKIVKKIIYRLLRTVPKQRLVKQAFKRTVKKKIAVGALLDMGPLIRKFDISKIEWLHVIDSNAGRWIVVIKLLHWFFAQYVIKILHKYIVVTSVKGQWVYIAKDDWCRMQEEFIKEKENTRCLVPWTPTSVKSTWKLPIGVYKFIPSSSGLRALFIAKYKSKEKYDNVDVVLRVLQQLYVTFLSKDGLPTVSSCEYQARKYKQSNKNQLYFVRCDIQDAFGSILQEKLFGIIKEYLMTLPKILTVRNYTLVRSKKYHTNNSNTAAPVQTVQFLNLEKAIKSAIMNKEKPIHVKMTKIVAKIHKLIFEHKMKWNGQVYSIKHGVPQGISVSPILSDIYYQHMYQSLFSQYASNGCLCRYVDDILYITDNENYAKKFLEIVRNGIPDYNVKFNPYKIQSNVDVPYKPTKIKFLGWTITL